MTGIGRHDLSHQKIGDRSLKETNNLLYLHKTIAHNSYTMKTTLRHRLIIALGISVGILLSFNLFGQNTPSGNELYRINSQGEYLQTVESIQELAAKLYDAHLKYPQLSYTHVYSGNGSLMGFSVTGVPQSSEADKISTCLMQLELLGSAISQMDQAYLPAAKNEKLNSRVSKKEAMKEVVEENNGESTVLATGPRPDELMAAIK